MIERKDRLDSPPYRWVMENIDLLTRHGLFTAQVPRYTSYPTAPIFSQDVGAAFQSVAIAALDPSEPVSVYIHIPFCERLCWFCACRTQGTRTLSPVEQYIETVKQELKQMAALLPDGVRMGRLHWGGGTPTILPPALIHDLAQAAKATFPPAKKFEFSVEIDPTLVDDAKIAALASEGMNRASIGIQDFSPDVQAAIGREQPFEATQTCVQSLRAAGITSLNADLVYGLPHQNAAKITDTVQKVLALNPDRIALFGYAHVPHMAKRQKLIKEETLPSDIDRFALSTLAADLFCKAGYQAIGTDHFAQPDDELAQAATRGDLRRNFQGYTTDTCSTLIGVGASSISRFAQGYVQNAAATGAYTQRIQDGDLSGFRGHELTVEDKLRARVIEMLMCNFEIDDAELAETYGTLAASLDVTQAQVLVKFDGVTMRGPNGLMVLPEGRALVRIIAQLYDGYSDTKAIFSKAS